MRGYARSLLNVPRHHRLRAWPDHTMCGITLHESGHGPSDRRYRAPAGPLSRCPPGARFRSLEGGVALPPGEAIPQLVVRFALGVEALGRVGLVPVDALERALLQVVRIEMDRAP